MENPPLLPYLIALPLLFVRDALVATGFVALLNVGAVGLAFLLGKRYFGLLPALIASLLFAVGFWPVTFSRFLWAQNFMPFLGGIAILGIYEAVVGRRRWFFLGSCLAVALLLQLHFSAVGLLPFLVVVAVVFYRRLGLVPLLGAVAIAGSYIPYLYHDGIQGWSNLRRLAILLGRPAAIDWGHWLYSLRLMGNLDHESWLGEGWLESSLFGGDWSNWVVGALFVVGVAAGVGKAGLCLTRHHGDEVSRYGLLALWVFLPLLFFTRASYPVYAHYFLGLYPAIFALAGLGGSQVAGGLIHLSRLRGLAGASAKAALAVLSLLVGTTVLSQAFVNLAAVQYVAEGRAIARRGIPLGDLQASLHEAGSVSRASGPSPVFIIGRGAIGEVMDSLGKLQLGAETLGDGSTLVFRGPRQVYLTFGEELSVTRFLKQNLGQWRVAEVPARGGGLLAQMFAIPTPELEVAASQALTLLGERLDNGVVVEGVSYPGSVERGSVLPVTLKWKVEQVFPETRESAYRFFLHLAPRPEAPQVAQEDGIGYPTQLWSVGDGFLSWLEVRVGKEIAPGDYYLRLGMYDLKTMKRADFLGQDNIPQGDFYLVGRVRID